MARRRTETATTVEHKTVTGQPPSAPAAAVPDVWTHPDAVTCPDCGRTAIGRMIHGPHTEKKK